MKKWIILGIIFGGMVTGINAEGNVKEKGLVARWNFDEGKGNITKDYSGNAVKIGGAKWVKGISGNALSFDGNDCIVCGTNTDFIFSGDFSVEIWVKQNTIAPQIYISKWTGSETESGWYLGYWDGKTRFGCYTSSESKFVSGSELCYGIWHQITGVRKGTKIYIYQDGNEISSGEITAGIAGENTAPLTIGNCAGTGGKWWFNGEIDEISIYNVALEKEQVIKNYREKMKVKIEKKVQSNNLILNPGFEKGLENWSISAHAGKILTGEIDRTVHHSGQNSVKISGTKNDRIAANYKVEVEPGKTYRFSVWAKGKNIVAAGEDGVKARLTFTDENNKVYINDPSLFQIFTSGLKGTFDWRKLTMEFVVPVPAEKDMRKVKCHIALFLWFGEGTVWFDDAELIKIEKGSAK